jgi:hypothetical protein
MNDGGERAVTDRTGISPPGVGTAYTAFSEARILD